MTSSKKHHYVSAFLLKRFADERGQLQAVPLDDRAPFIASFTDLGQRNKGHRVSPMHNANPDIYEAAHAELESRAAPILREWADNPTARIVQADKAVIERFLVLHDFRRPPLMEATEKSVDLDLGRLEGTATADTIRRDMMIQAASFAAVLDRPELHAVGDEVERWRVYEAYFAEFEWQIVRYEAPVLVIGDRLVLKHGHTTAEPYSDEWKRGQEGGAGLANCTRLTMPLSPRVGLLLTRDSRLLNLRYEAFNRTTIVGAQRLVMHAPRWAEESPAAFAHAKRYIDAVRSVRREQQNQADLPT